MYGIIHGGMDLALRLQSIDYMTSLPFDGFAMGGALGKDRCARVSLGTSAYCRRGCQPG